MAEGANRRPGFRRRPGLIAVVAAIALATAAALVVRHGLSEPRATRAAGYPSTVGVYAGPAKTGVARAAEFDAAMGVASTEVLDFAADDSWFNIAGPSWLLGPHSAQQARLEYSLPMFPQGEDNSLEACADGQYASHWTTLARNLVAADLARTIVRPGWEFNGTWYRWSAVGKPATYVRCFRQIVGAMRAVPGGQFAFDWNPTVGQVSMNADQAYPGDEFVDYIGVDVYDVSPKQYSRNTATPAQQSAAWAQLSAGVYGLQWWAGFARAHGKSLALPEWGVTRLANGQGGGDDPSFVDHIFDFMTDPSNKVAYEHYFNFGSASGTHDLTDTGAFGQSAARFRVRLQGAIDARARR